MENTTLAGNEIDSFNVTFGPSITVTSAGVLANDDLDTAGPGHPGHNAGNFAFLATEEEPFIFLPFVNITTQIDIDNVSWLFPQNNVLPQGWESETLFLISPNQPGYVGGQVADGLDPSPWHSLALNSEPVVGPVPEPGALTLFGVGLLVTGASLRRTRREN